MPLAIKAGLEPNILEKVFLSASSKSFASEYFVPRILDRNFNTDFSMEAAYKDIINIQELATKYRAAIPITNAMTSSYQSTIGLGFGKEPKSAMIKFYESILGVAINRNSKKI